MALSTENALELSIKQIRTVRDIIRAYSTYKHRISREERRLLYELVGMISETKDLAINTTRQISEDRWEE